MTDEISAVRRAVSGRVLEAGEARVVAVSRSYPAELADVPAKVASWSASEEGRRFLTASSIAWYAASVAFGPGPAEARAAADRTSAFFTGTP